MIASVACTPPCSGRGCDPDRHVPDSAGYLAYLAEWAPALAKVYWRLSLLIPENCQRMHGHVIGSSGSGNVQAGIGGMPFCARCSAAQKSTRCFAVLYPETVVRPVVVKRNPLSPITGRAAMIAATGGTRGYDIRAAVLCPLSGDFPDGAVAVEAGQLGPSHAASFRTPLAGQRQQLEQVAEKASFGLEGPPDLDDFRLIQCALADVLGVRLFHVPLSTTGRDRGRCLGSAEGEADQLSVHAGHDKVNPRSGQ